MTALALAFCFLPPLWAASSVSAAPGVGWQTPVDLDGGTGNIYNVHTATDNHGDVWVAWTQWNGTGTFVFVREYTNGVGWSPAVAFGSGSANSVSVAANGVGDVFLAWDEYNGTNYIERVARYEAGWGWSGAYNVTGTTGNVYNEYTSIDGSGYGYLLMPVSNGTADHVYGARFGPTLGSPSAVLLSSASNATWEYALASGRVNGAWYMWTEYNGTVTHAYVMQAHPTFFGAPAQLDDKAGYVFEIQLGMDDAGVATAVWYQYDGAGNYMQFSRTTWNGWSAPEAVFGGYAYSPILRVAPSGVAMLETTSWNGVAYAPSVTWLYPDRPVWETVVHSSTNTSTYWAGPAAAVDDGGFGLVLFTRNVSSQWPVFALDVGYYAFNDLGTLQESGNNANVTGLQVEMLANGKALGVWMEQGASSWHLRANLYVVPDFNPPWVHIDSPFNGAISTTPYTTVSGWTEPGARVFVNGAMTTADARGYWQTQVTLAPGSNWIWAYAVDAAGNGYYSGNSRFVTYEDPATMKALEARQAGRTGWQDPADLDPVQYWGSWWPLMVTDARGFAYLVWYEYAYDTYHAYLARYVPGQGWDAPIELQGEEGYLNGNARITIDAGGNATVVWTITDFNNRWSHVYNLIYFAAGWTWGPNRMDTGRRFANWPDAAPMGDGRLLYVWDQREEVNRTYHTLAMTINTSTYVWSTPQQIETFANSTDIPRVAVDGSGNAWVTARRWNAATTQANAIAVMRYNGTAWDNGTVVENVPDLASMIPVAVDAGGNATIAWNRYVNNTFFTANTERWFKNSGWAGARQIWNDSWSWDPEVIADDRGDAFVAITATVNGTADALVSAALPGGNASTPVRMDNGTGHGGGPKLSKGLGGAPVRAHWDEFDNNHWNAYMREYNVTSGNWSAVIRLSPDSRNAHIPTVAPMPDGGFMVGWSEDNATLGYEQIVAARYVPRNTTAPLLTVATPVDGSTTTVGTSHVHGTAEAGAYVTVNGLPVVVQGNGTFDADVALVNGSNVVAVTARSTAPATSGNMAFVNRTVTFDDPDRRRIEDLEAQNAALQQALNNTNASLWQALRDQNASLLGVIAGQNASLLASLAAQNSSLLGAIGNLNASLLASLAAQNATLRDLIASTDTSLLASLAAANASLTAQIADLNLSLLADLAGQNAALLDEIASTNATLFGALLAQNASLTGALAAQDSALLASLAAQNASLRDLIGSTDASLLASLAAENTTLTGELAALNSTLLASLAAQNSDLRDAIGRTNTTLLAELAAQNATLRAELEAQDTALRGDLAAAQTANSNADAGQNSSLGATQSDLDKVRGEAQGAGTLALAGTAIGLAGVAAAAVAVLLSRRRPPMPPDLEAAPPPAAPADSAPAAAPASGPSRGHSMGAEGELQGTAEVET